MSEHTVRRPLGDAWALYQATQLSAHAGESECRALEDAFLSGARAAFGVAFAAIDAANERDEVRILLEDLVGEALAHDTA